MIFNLALLVIGCIYAGISIYEATRETPSKFTVAVYGALGVVSFALFFAYSLGVIA
jgi:hypothetical protein